MGRYLYFTSFLIFYPLSRLLVLTMLLSLLFLCVFLVIYKIWTINKNYWKDRNVVEVSNAAWDLILGRCSLPEIYKKVYDKSSTNHGGMYLGFKPVLVLRNLEDIKAVLVTDFQSFHSRGYELNPKDVLAENLLLINDYLTWRLVRQKISPVFTSRRLKNMFQVINQCASDLILSLRNIPKERPLEILNKYTSASISATLFGLDTEKNSIESPLLKIAWNSADTPTLFTLKIGLCSTFPRISNLLNLTLFDSHKDVVLNVLRNALERRQHLPCRRLDFIDTCLEMQQEMKIRDYVTGFEMQSSDEFLAAQAFSFFVAGVDTSANAMNFILLELANNPSILEQVHKEIDEAFENHKTLNYQDVLDLKYMDMVLKESLRKYPPIGSMQRECSKDTILPTNLKVEKGTIVVIPIYALHMDDSYFPRPHIFDPERFSADNMPKIKKFAYLPFGEGNRICIGAKYARLQIKTTLALLLREYTLKSSSYTVNNFEPSFFNLRDSRAKYEITPRKSVLS